MLINNEIFNKIDEIVERSYIDFTFDIIGDKFFTTEQKRQLEGLGLIIGNRPLIELLYILVRQRSVPGYHSDKTFQQIINEVAQTGALPIINDTHLYSIDHAKLQIQEAIEDTKKEIKKKVKQVLLKVNNDYKNDIAVSRITSIPDQSKKIEHSLHELKKQLNPLKIGIGMAFLRAFTTAITNTINNAVIDEASIQGMVNQENPKDIKVYKQVMSDGRLCNWCSHFYTNPNGTPKIYSLKELQANGSNDGKAKGAWLPTVGATHPRCRCQLKYFTQAPTHKPK
jgi:hypothetical protein